jgi:CoA:oxalate CoA-transferase
MAERGPLTGTVVVDFSWNLPGPYCTWMLAGLGATVIKVEPPRGDPARHLGTLFDWVNAGKQSLVFDPKDEASRAAVEALIRRADVLVEGFRPGKFAALGFGEDRLKALQPSLVRCSISAYGQTGPLVQEPGHDLNVAAMAGAVALNEDPQGRPQPLPLPLADLSAAQLACARICAALLDRERTGQGVFLDVAMVDAVASWTALWSEGVDLCALGEAAMPRYAVPVARPLLKRLLRKRLRSLPHYAVYACADGEWLAIGVVDEAHFWRGLCEAVGMQRVAGLPMGARAVLGPALRRWLARCIRREPRSVWLERLKGLPVSPVLSVPEARAAFAYRHGDGRGPFAGAVSLPAAPSLGSYQV